MEQQQTMAQHAEALATMACILNDSMLIIRWTMVTPKPINRPTMMTNWEQRLELLDEVTGSWSYSNTKIHYGVPLFYVAHEAINHVHTPPMHSIPHSWTSNPVNRFIGECLFLMIFDRLFFTIFDCFQSIEKLNSFHIVRFDHICCNFIPWIFIKIPFFWY